MRIPIRRLVTKALLMICLGSFSLCSIFWIVGYWRHAYLSLLLPLRVYYVTAGITAEGGAVELGVGAGILSRAPDEKYFSLYFEQEPKIFYNGGDYQGKLGFDIIKYKLSFESDYGVVAPGWFWTILSGIFPAIWIVRRVRHACRPDNLCANCGYDLRATPGRCPECGTVRPVAPLIAGGTEEKKLLDNKSN